MSKKQKIFNRLENLFSTIEKSSIQARPEPTPSQSGWSWQIDANGIFISCSPEIYGLLDLTNEEIIGQSSFSFCLEESQAHIFKELLQSNSFPAESVLVYNTINKSFKVRVHVLSSFTHDGKNTGWSGFSQILSETEIEAAAPHYHEKKPQNTRPIAPPLSPLPQTRSLNLDHLGISVQPWTQAAWQGISSQKTTIQNAKENNPAVIAMPFQIGEQRSGVIEIVDDESQHREWDEDERLLVQEIANQLGLAIENAQLYSEIEAVATERQRYLREAERRALELQTAAEIARDTTQTLSLEELLAQNVYLLCERFGFYHASIFLLDEAGENAVVRASTGKAGEEMLSRKHKLAVGSRSIIGTVTAR